MGEELAQLYISDTQPRAHDGAPPRGTRRHRKLHETPRDTGIVTQSPGSGSYIASLNMRSETTLPCASTTTAP